MFLGLSGFAQITNPSAYSESTKYSDNDKVFVFCSETTSTGSLTADDSTSVGGFDFKWYKYNSATSDFSDAISGFTINNDSTSSTITNLTTGGYKVELTKGVELQEYVAWVYINNELSVEIDFHDENNCDYLALVTVPYYHTSMYFDTPLIYYDISTGDEYTLQNKMSSYEWTVSPEEDDFRSFNGPFVSIVEDASDNEAELPTENSTFNVLVEDKFGCIAEDDIEYQAIETDANFTWTTIDDKTLEIIETGDSDNEIAGPAPLVVRFTNASLNGQDYTWFFGDSLWNNDVDTVKTSDFMLEPEHTYYFSLADSGKTYVMRMFSENEHGCKDSIFFNITVEPSVIEFPNVFTPTNADGVNDIFIVREGYKSIRDFKITIFNRVGQVVHEYEGDIRDWEGWKGKVRDSNREAPPGNYFFVVEATGWDNFVYNNNKPGSTPSTEGSEGSESSGANRPQFGIVRLF